MLATSVLDTGSELNIITQDCFKKLGLKGEPRDINIIGAPGVVTRTRTKRTYWVPKRSSNVSYLRKHVEQRHLLAPIS